VKKSMNDLFELTKFLVVTVAFVLVGVFLLMRSVEAKSFDFLWFTAGAISIVFAGILGLAFITAVFSSLKKEVEKYG